MDTENALCPVPDKDLFDTIREDGRPILLYGMGNGAEKMLSRLAAVGRTPAGVFASDAFVRGQSFRGYTVRRFADLHAAYPDALILVSFATRQPDVMRDLLRMAEEYPCLMPDMPVAGDKDFTRDFYAAHREELQAVYDLLEDNPSKMMFERVIRYKLSGDFRLLRDAVTPENTPLPTDGCAIRTAIDGGAYTGDTAEELLAAHPECVRVFAVEPDGRNYRKLETFAARDARVVPVRGLLWDTAGIGRVAASGNRNSTMFDPSHESRTEEVPCVTVDEIAGEKAVDYIKYDVEGAEYEALRGTRGVILRDRPILAVSLYHRSEDLFRLPLYLHEIRPDYRFRLGRRPCFPAWELTLYAY